MLSPTWIWFIVETLVAVDWEESQVATCCDFLALSWEVVSWGIENSVEEKHPTFYILEIPQIVRNGDVEGWVEGFEDLGEQPAGGFAEVPEDLFQYLLESGEELVYKYLQFLTLLVFVVLAHFRHLSAEVDSSLDATREIVHEVVLYSWPRVINYNYDIQDLFIELDCVSVVPNLIVELEEVASEYFLLLVADPAFYRVVSGEQVVFESAENHDKKLIFLFGNE